MPHVRHCDVLIAGLGPVGATLAALLGQAGLSVIAIEAEWDIHQLPRAAHIDHEIMRIFQAVGIAEAIAPHMRPAPDYEFRAANGGTLMRVERAGRLGASGWPVSCNIYQPGIEHALRDRLSALPNVRVVRGSRFTGLEAQTGERVLLHCREDGAVAQYSGRFMVGCDGARSDVRQACFGGLDDYGFDEPWLVVDATIDDESGFPPHNIQYCDPSRPTTFVHMGPGRLRWEFMLKPGESVEAMRADGAVASLLAPWRQCGAFQVERRAVYRFHGLIARRWRHGRVFIAGDAAHQMPPFMGQGLCSGLRDAANLAWKLHAAVRGSAGEALLDSYQQERAPHVAFVVRKAIEMGRLVCTLDPEVAAARDARMLPNPVCAPPAALPALAAGCLLREDPAAGCLFPQPHNAPSPHQATGRLDDRLGSGAWLLHAGKTPPQAAFPNLRVIGPDALDGAQARAVGDWLLAHGGESVLVRPDRVVFGTGKATDLVQSYAAWLSPAGSPCSPLPPDPERGPVLLPVSD